MELDFIDKNSIKMLLRVAIVMCIFILKFDTSFGQKNIVSINQSTIFSKLLFEEEILDFFERNPGPFAREIENRPLTKGIFSSTISLSFQRQVIPKLFLGITARRLTRGLKSETSILENSTLPNNIDIGVVYRLQSYELGLILNYEFLTKKNINISLAYTFAYDSHLILRINQEIFPFGAGGVVVGGSQTTHLRLTNENFWDYIKQANESKLFRYSHYLSINCNINTIIKNLQLTSSLTIGGSTRNRATDRRVTDFLPDGNIFYASLNLGISYKF